MREFKFRAWSETLKKMDYSPMNAIGFDGCIYFGNADITGFHDCIMQYTGLHDKNGKEIYEGDIVANTVNDRKAEVKFGEYISEFGTRLYGFYYHTCDYQYDVRADTKNMYIIGNIYENPELLENV